MGVLECAACAVFSTSCLAHEARKHAPNADKRPAKCARALTTAQVLIDYRQQEQERDRQQQHKQAQLMAIQREEDAAAAAEGKHLHALRLHSKTRLRAASRAFRWWHDYAGERERTQRLLVAHSQRLAHRRAVSLARSCAKALHLWYPATARKVALRDTLQRALSRQASLLHKRAWSSWHAATRAMRKLRRAMSRLQGGGLARSFTRWRESASGARRHNIHQQIVLRRAAGLTQLRALYQWRLSAKALQTTNDTARRALMSMLNFCIARSFRRWVSKMLATRQLKHGLQMQQSHLELLDLQTGAHVISSACRCAMLLLCDVLCVLFQASFAPPSFPHRLTCTHVSARRYMHRYYVCIYMMHIAPYAHVYAYVCMYM